MIYLKRGVLDYGKQWIPYLKNMGVKGRTRLYEIPKTIKYTIVNPRMKLYMEKSKSVVSIYLDYVSKEDLHIKTF